MIFPSLKSCRSEIYQFVIYDRQTIHCSRARDAAIVDIIRAKIQKFTEAARNFKKSLCYL